MTLLAILLGAKKSSGFPIMSLHAVNVKEIKMTFSFKKNVFKREKKVRNCLNVTGSFYRVPEVPNFMTTEDKCQVGAELRQRVLTDPEVDRG